MLVCLFYYRIPPLLTNWLHLPMYFRQLQFGGLYVINSSIRFRKRQTIYKDQLPSSRTLRVYNTEHRLKRHNFPVLSRLNGSQQAKGMREECLIFTTCNIPLVLMGKTNQTSHNHNNNLGC